MNGDPSVTSYGFHDDGTESGAIREILAQGNLVQLPFWRTNYSVSLSGSSSAPSFSGTGSDSQDGVGTNLYTTVAHSATLGNGIKINMRIFGNVFGLRCQGSAPNTPAPSVVIDGVPYPLQIATWLNPITQAADAHATNHSALAATDLGMGTHYVEIIFPCDLVNDWHWNLYGYIVDGEAGYVPAQPGGALGGTQITCTASGQALAGSGSNTGIRGGRIILFRNPGAAAAVVALKSSQHTNDFFSKSIAAGDTFVLDLTQQSYDFTEWTVRETGTVQGVVVTVGGAR